MTETNTESGMTHTGEERSRRTSEASEESQGGLSYIEAS